MQRLLKMSKEKSSIVPITGATTRRRVDEEEPSLWIRCSGRIYPASIFPALYLHFGNFAKSCFLKFCHALLQNDRIQNAGSLRVRAISAWRHKKVPKAESGLPSANNNLFSQPFADNNRLLHGFTGNVLCRFKTNENSY